MFNFNFSNFVASAKNATNRTKKTSYTQEEREERRNLREQLKSIESQDAYCLTKGELSRNWIKAQNIRALLGMRYETFNPYAH